MKSVTVGEAIGGVVAGLEESIRQAEAEADELTARAEEMLFRAARLREEASRQRGVQSDLDGRLGAIVQQFLRDRLGGEVDSRGAGGTTRTSPSQESHPPQRARTGSKDRQRGPVDAAADQDHSLTSRSRKTVMEDPDPDRIWTSAVLRGYFPGEPTVKFNKILKRLCDEGTVVRLSGAPGRYRRAVGAPGSAPALVEIRTGDPAWDVDATLSPSPEDPSVDFRSVAHLERQIVEVLRSPSGRRWRPDQLASALGVPVSAVEAVLPTLLADKEIEKPVDGAYIATDPAIAEEGWPRVS